MEREVRYCTTEDGVRIAYTVTGSGPPILLRTDSIVSHVQLEWSVPMIARALERIVQSNTLIRFDQRGSGMSDRAFASTLDDAVADTEAVADALQLERFTLAAVQGASLAAIPYASRHPERVANLILMDGFLKQRDLLSTPQIQAIMGAAVGDFLLATEAIAVAVFGPGRAESLTYGAYIRSCIGPEYFARVPAVISDDATPYASGVTMPTLVVRHGGLQYVTEEMTRDLVAHLPDARLVTVPGLWADDPERVANIALAFANEGTVQRDLAASSKSAVSVDMPIRTVLFTDLAGSTEMMQRLGDERGRAVLREHERATREVLKEHGGTEVKTMGDGFMASFGSVTRAVECAVALQRAVAQREGEPLSVRIGLNAGEPIEEGGDLFGATVILAARIAARAEGGEILASDVVRGLCSGKGFLFADRGEFVAKGFEEPVRLFEVRWRPE